MLTVKLTLPLARFTLDVDFRSDARVTGLFGRSGAGKSSLLEAIIGLRPGARGHVSLGGDAWLDGTRAQPPEARDVGYVPQQGLLFPHLTVEENLATGTRRARRRGQDVSALRAQVVETLELAPLLAQRPASLSGGERQRVALARALSSAPKLLVLDEPLASLDAAMQQRLLPFLARVRETFAVPMLYVSHAALEISALCDHVIALEEGKIVADGPPHAVLPSRMEAGARIRSVFAVHDEGDGRVRLAGTDVRLVTRGGPACRMVAIPADVVILARTKPTDTTAANVLEARIAHVATHAAHDLVHVHLAEGHPPLLVEVTHASRARLGLEAGVNVAVILKATSIERL